MNDEWVGRVIGCLEDWDFESALKEAEEALEVADTPEKRGEVYLLISAVAEHTGDRGKRGEALFKALEIFRSLGDRAKEIQVLALIADAHLEREAESAVDDALNCYSEALKIALHDKALYRQLLPRILSGVGSALVVRDSELSREFFKLSSRLEEKYKEELESD
ncbi:MAG: hypothetical protein U9M98_00360 [Patescibacteria group bacterium]|nr:hypothetical protein [Patescibacteria group bacterium]